MTAPYMGGMQPPRRPRTMQEIADSVRMQNQQPGTSGRSMEEIAASVLGTSPQQPTTFGDWAKGLSRAAAQGLTFQNWDEIEGGLSALGAGDYKTERDRVRSEMQQFEQAHKGPAIAAEVTGAIVPTVGAMLASGGTATPAVLPSLGARVARAAGAGAFTGGLTGFGAAPEMQDVPGSTAMGAGLGAAAGSAFPLAGAGLRRVGNKVLDLVETPMRAAAENVPDRAVPTTVRVLADSVGGRAAGAATGKLKGVAQDATQYGFGPAFAKHLGLPVLERRAKSRAEQKLMQALMDDGLTPEQAAARMEGMIGRGAPAAVADAGDENLLELTNVPFLIPGEGRKTVSQYFRERVMGASGRLAEGVERSSGARMGNVKKMVTEIGERRKPPAKKLYEAAYAHGPVDVDGEVLDFMMTNDARAAWYEGLRRSRLEAFTDADKTPLAPLYDVTMNEAGEKVIVMLRQPTVRDIDVIKRGVDRAVKKAQNKGDKELAMLLRNNKERMLEQVDAQAPKFAEARAYWAGESGLMEALEAGKKFLRGGDDDFELIIEKLNPDERDMFRIGAANAIAEALRRREGRAVAVNVLTDPTARRRLEQLYPDEASWKLMADIVEDETKMAGPFARMSRQSQTAQNLAGLLDFATDFRPGDLVPDPKSMGIRALFGLANAGTQRANTSSAAQLAKLLTQQGPEGVAYLRGLQSKAAADAAVSRNATRAEGRLGGLIGGRITRGY